MTAKVRNVMISSRQESRHWTRKATSIPAQKRYSHPTRCSFVTQNSGMISYEGSAIGHAIDSSLKDRAELVMNFWESFEDHEASHRSSNFQPLFREVLERRGNGNEEIAYDPPWSGKAYSSAKAAREAKARYAVQASQINNLDGVSHAPFRPPHCTWWKHFPQKIFPRLPLCGSDKWRQDLEN